MIRIAIAEIQGRMGNALAEMIEGSPEFDLVGGVVRPGANTINVVAKRWVRYPIVDRVEAVLSDVQVLIDVSSAEATMHHALACVQAGCGIVVATRGLDPNHVAELEEFSRRIPVFYAPNLCIEAAVVNSILPTLHTKLPEMSIETRDINTSADIAPKQRTACSAVLESQTTGQVTVFSSGDQEIVLHHRVFGLDAYARGALRAAAFIASRSHGFYSMRDLIEMTPPVARSTPAVYEDESAASVSGNGG